MNTKVATILIFSLILPSPTFALREEQRVEAKKSGLEEIVSALLSGQPVKVKEAATQLASAAGFPSTPPVPSSMSALLEDRSTGLEEEGHNAYEVIFESVKAALGELDPDLETALQKVHIQEENPVPPSSTSSSKIFARIPLHGSSLFPVQKENAKPQLYLALRRPLKKEEHARGWVNLILVFLQGRSPLVKGFKPTFEFPWPAKIKKEDSTEEIPTLHDQEPRELFETTLRAVYEMMSQYRQAIADRKRSLRRASRALASATISQLDKTLKKIDSPEDADHVVETVLEKLRASSAAKTELRRHLAKFRKHQEVWTKELAQDPRFQLLDQEAIKKILLRSGWVQGRRQPGGLRPDLDDDLGIRFYKKPVEEALQEYLVGDSSIREVSSTELHERFKRDYPRLTERKVKNILEKEGWKESKRKGETGTPATAFYKPHPAGPSAPLGAGLEEVGNGPNLEGMFREIKDLLVTKGAGEQDIAERLLSSLVESHRRSTDTGYRIKFLRQLSSLLRGLHTLGSPQKEEVLDRLKKGLVLATQKASAAVQGPYRGIGAHPFQPIVEGERREFTVVGTYTTGHPSFVTEALMRGIAVTLHDRKPDERLRLLEVGPGYGLVTAWMAAMFPNVQDVVAVDTNWRAKWVIEVNALLNFSPESLKRIRWVKADTAPKITPRVDYVVVNPAQRPGKRPGAKRRKPSARDSYYRDSPGGDGLTMTRNVIRSYAGALREGGGIIAALTNWLDLSGLDKTLQKSRMSLEPIPRTSTTKVYSLGKGTGQLTRKDIGNFVAAEKRGASYLFYDNAHPERALKAEEMAEHLKTGGTLRVTAEAYQLLPIPAGLEEMDAEEFVKRYPQQAANVPRGAGRIVVVPEQAVTFYRPETLAGGLEEVVTAEQSQFPGLRIDREPIPASSLEVKGISVFIWDSMLGPPPYHPSVPVIKHQLGQPFPYRLPQLVGMALGIDGTLSVSYAWTFEHEGRQVLALAVLA